jgi:hypothetical protein
MSEVRDKQVKIGQGMWLHIHGKFMQTAKQAGAIDVEGMAAVWGGFLAALVGSAITVFGKQNTLTILRSVLRDAERMEDRKNG